MGNGSARIDRIETQLVLMAIHCIDNDACRVVGHLDAGHIAIGINRHLKAIYLVRLYVIAPSRHHAVVVSSLRILVRVFAWIVGILFILRSQTFVHLQRVGLYLRLVVAQPAQHSAVGIEGKSLVEAKLLLVNPVGQSVDNLIELAVLCYLNLGIVVQQFNKEDVVVAYKSHLLSILRPCRNLLRTTIAQRVQSARSDVIDVEYSLVRAAVYALCLGLYKHALAVRRKRVAVKTVNLLAKCVVGIE